MMVRYRPCPLRPVSKTRWNSPRRRIRRAAGRVLDGMGILAVCASSWARGLFRGARRIPLAATVSLPGGCDRQAFATLRATAREDLPALLGRHADEKAVRPLPVPPVRLKCTFALRHDSGDLWSGFNRTEKLK